MRSWTQSCVKAEPCTVSLVLYHHGSRTHDRGEQTEDGGDEDSSASSEQVVKRVVQPASAEGRGDVRRGIDETDDPLVARGVGFAGRVVDTELDRERQVGAVGSGLVPTLNGGADRGQHNGEDQCSRLVPLVCRPSAPRPGLRGPSQDLRVLSRRMTALSDSSSRSYVSSLFGFWAMSAPLRNSSAWSWNPLEAQNRSDRAKSSSRLNPYSGFWILAHKPLGGW